MDGCKLMNKSSATKEKDEQFYAVVSKPDCQNLKSSQPRLARGSCKKSIFFAVRWHLSTLYTFKKKFQSVWHLWFVNPRQVDLTRAFRAALIEHVMPFSSPWYSCHGRADTRSSRSVSLNGASPRQVPGYTLMSPENKYPSKSTSLSLSVRLFPLCNSCT